MKHMSAQNMSLANQVSQLPIVQPPPPLPKEDTKPPLPPNNMNTYQFTSMPPPHQNNLPLFPVKQNANTPMQQTNIQNCPQNPPLPPTQPPLPPENNNSTKENNSLNGKRSNSIGSESNSAKKLKIEDEELTEAEKTFDAQFKQWEEQFNKWKQQNANHPDKVSDITIIITYQLQRKSNMMTETSVSDLLLVLVLFEKGLFYYRHNTNNTKLNGHPGERSLSNDVNKCVGNASNKSKLLLK